VVLTNPGAIAPDVPSHYGCWKITLAALVRCFISIQLWCTVF